MLVVADGESGKWKVLECVFTLKWDLIDVIIRRRVRDHQKTGRAGEREGMGWYELCNAM